MELLNNTRLAVNLTKIGLSAIVNTAVFVNRAVIRPRLKSNIYDRISLQAEHVLHYGTYAMAIDGLADIITSELGFSSQPVITYLSSVVSWLYGFNIDGLRPKRPQVDQLVSNTIGCTVYSLTATLLLK